MLGPITTVWTNGVVDIEAKTWREYDGPYHEYSLYACKQENPNDH